MDNHQIIDGYRQLANAIIIMAANDYRKALKRHYSGTCSCIRAFFHSDMFEAISPIDADKLIQMLEREYAEKQKTPHSVTTEVL